MECDNSVNPVGNRHRLLVAEDNPSNFKLVEVLLRRDYELVHAWDGRQAVDMFAEVHPDLVLMDINMPVMDGYDALRLIRERAPSFPLSHLRPMLSKPIVSVCFRPDSTNAWPSRCVRTSFAAVSLRCFRGKRKNYDR